MGKFKDEDNKQKDRISAKNGLESYCFNMKTTIETRRSPTRSPRDKKKITEKCDEAIKWLDANQLAEVEEFQEKEQEACLTWEECLEVCQELEELHQAEFLDPDQPS